MANDNEITINQVDIQENYILKNYGEAVLKRLLKDHTTSRTRKKDDGEYTFIIWATDKYEPLGTGYHFHDEITIERITGQNSGVIKPRVVKSREEQQRRVRDKAEVFTPSWVCNKQNNLIDEAWFGRKNVFNSEIDNPDGSHTWHTTEGKIAFPNDSEKTWQRYVEDTRLEITCGEAPYLVSRYDTITGEFIYPLNARIGLLDRKFRVINENVNDRAEWEYWAKIALQSTYGYEWQGDSLLIARENLLFTFIDNYRDKFQSEPSKRLLQYVAYVISWNIWQMDGLKFVVPRSCENANPKPVSVQMSLFAEPEIEPFQKSICDGCTTGDNTKHDGDYCMIRDWKAKKKSENDCSEDEDTETIKLYINLTTTNTKIAKKIDNQIIR